jgi:hypothetical protein
MTHDTKAAEPALPEPVQQALDGLNRQINWLRYGRLAGGTGMMAVTDMEALRDYITTVSATIRALAGSAPDADAASPAVERDAPAPFTHAQLERLYLNSPAAQNVIGFTGFARIVRLAESAHRITNQAPGEMTHG